VSNNGSIKLLKIDDNDSIAIYPEYV